VDNLLQQHSLIAAEWSLPRKQFEQDYADRVDIGTPVRGVGVSLRLLWRHVRGSAQQLTVDRHSCLGGFPFGQAKIHDVRFTSRIEHNIRWFQITVNDAVLVSVLQCVGNLETQLRRFTGGGSPTSKPVCQSHPLDQVADDVHAVLISTDLMDTHDSCMLELRGGASFS
jgi:hypothetical protein